MMAKLTKKQIDELQNANVVGLLCDGYNLEVFRRISKNKIRYFVAVEGAINMDWLFEPDKYIESKFYRPNVLYRKLSKRSKKMTKFETGNKKLDYASMGQALRHLNKVCDSVELISVNGLLHKGEKK